MRAKENKCNDKDVRVEEKNVGSREQKRNRQNHYKGKKKVYRKEENKLDESRSNNPKWYFTDEKLADQVSQLSFQQLAGMPLEYDNFQFDVPNVNPIHIQPAPGVQISSQYNTGLSQHSAINMVGFKLYSKLSAYTGRTQSYAPQDVSTMILAFGEVISVIEFIRRAFGVAYTMNMRNRAYPRTVLEKGMYIDSTDMFANLSDYRTRFNTIVTLVNQLPIPGNIAYYDKCAKLYEGIYLDSPSSMAQTLLLVPHTTWLLDETSYSGGSILKTIPFCCDANFVPPAAPNPLSYYLNIAMNLVNTLLNSSTLQVVYTDMLNLASKQDVKFWRFDYLFEGYTVIPQYDTNFLLQMHNATICGFPREVVLVTGTNNVTPRNDVYPDPNKNCLFYNPSFSQVAGSGTNRLAKTGNCALIDMLNDAPNVTDRVEVTRFTACAKGTPYTTTQNLADYIDTALPDHYVVGCNLELMTNNLTEHWLTQTVIASSAFADFAALLSNIDWAPRVFEADSTGNSYTGRYTGDINYYTTVDMNYLRKLHDFVGLGLYDMR